MTDRPTESTDRPELRPAAPRPESVDSDRPAVVSTTNRPTPEPTDPDATAKPTDRPRRRLIDRLMRRPTDPTSGDRPTKTKRPTNTDPSTHTRPTTPAPTNRPTAVDKPTRPTTPTQTDRPATPAVAYRPTTKPTANRPQRTTAPTDRTDTDIAPIPTKLKWIGIWVDRTFGSIPLVAPLIVSGYYTMQVFTDQPIDAHGLIALAATSALEGGVWKLARLYEKTLVAGDSTIALRAGIGLYLGIISGLIYWHADHQAKLSGREDIGWDWIPAAGVAVMSALGVFIWSRSARWLRRRELHEAGRIDRQAPKFSSLAWLLTPIETPKALRHAVKWRIDSPLDAVTDRRLYAAAGKPALWHPLAWKPTDEPTDRIDRPTVEPTNHIDHAPTDQTSRPTKRLTDPTDHTQASTAPTRPTNGQATDQTPTDQTPADHRPASANRPAATAPTDRTRPTFIPEPRPADHRPTGLRPTADRPAAAASRPTGADQSAHTPAAVANASYLRAHYRLTGLPKLSTIRADLKWSFDRANNAVRAYNDGADLPTDHTTDRLADQTEAVTVR